MKKVKLLFTSLISLGLLVASCGSSGSSDNPPSPAPTPVVVPVTGVSSSEEAFTIVVGEEHSLVYTIAPENATNKNVSVASNSACVGIEGTKVVGSLPGEAQVSLTTEDGNFSVVYTVTVVAELSSIEVSGEYKTEYYVNDEFDKTGIVVTAKYKDGTSVDVTADATFSGFDSSVAGTVEVTASFGGKTASFEVTVKAINKISFADVVEQYKAKGLEVVIPDYLSENGELLIEKGLYFITGSNRDEMDAFALALGESGWNLTVDTFNDYEGNFGDTIAAIYVGDYLDKEAYHNAILIQFYMPADFPSEEINADLAAAGASETLPSYSGISMGYEYNPDDNQLLVVCPDGTSGRTLINAYAEDLLAAGYTEAGADTYGDMHYASPKGELDVCAWDGADVGYDGYVFVDIVVNLKALSFASVVASYLEEGLEVVIPDYIGNDKIELEYNEEKDLYVVKNSSADEMEAFAASMLKAGWNLQSDSWGDYSGFFGDTLARVYIGDYIDYSYAGIVIQFDLLEPAEFPAEQIAADLEAAGVIDRLPAYSGVATQFAYISGESGRYLAFEPVDDLEDAVALYQADLLAAGYTELGEDSWGDMHYASPNDELDVCVYASSLYGYVFADVEIIEHPIPVESVPFDDVIEAFAGLGVEVVIPNYEGDGLSYLLDGATYYIYGSSEEGMEAFAASMKEAGWVLEQDFAGDYEGSFGETDAKVAIQNYLEDEGGAIVVSFGYEASQWPAEEIAEDLAKYGVTDVLPAYSGEATGYYYNASYKQLSFMPSVSEASAVATYQADLLAAGYTEAGADTYGDMHYTSPNGQLDVCAWKGSDAGASGYVIIDIEINSVEPEVLYEFPVEEVEAYLAELGAEIEIPEYVAASAEAYFEIDDSDPEAFVVYVTGSDADELVAYTALFTEEAGWYVMEYDGDYYAMHSETGVVVSMVDFGDYIGLAFSVYAY